MKKWCCTVCGYEAEGDNPPDICPVCGVDHTIFELVETKGDSSAIDEETLKRIKTSIRQFSYGMFIVTTKSGDKVNGQTANTVFQLTSEPNQIGVALNNGNYTNELVKESKKLAVHVMGQDSLEILGHFGFQSGRTVDKFKNYPCEIVNDLPLLKKEALSILKGHVVNALDVDTHTLFIVNVKDGFVNEDKKSIEPMTYSDFRTLKKGGTLAKNTETKVEKQPEIKKERGENAMDMTKYVCTVCGYVHDPAVKGVAFADLPDSYKCPVCGVGKDQFEPEA